MFLSLRPDLYSKFRVTQGYIGRLSQRKKGKELQSPVEAQVGNKSLGRPSWPPPGPGITMEVITMEAGLSSALNCEP